MPFGVAKDRVALFIIFAISAMLIAWALSGCSRVYYAADVLRGNHQGEACYLKCWSQGQKACVLANNQPYGYLYDPTVPVAQLVRDYTCTSSDPLL